MLATRNLHVNYGSTTAVSALDLTLGHDEIVTLVGPTGCGKTSVLRAIAGLVDPAAGEIRLGKRCITAKRSAPPEKRRVGLVFQDFALFPHLSVENNIAFRLQNRAPAERWIERLGLQPHRHARPETLSGGQKQRVALARALAHAPSILLLDEPLASLDAALKAELRWEIRDALKTAGVPAIWVTHDQTEALSVADRMGIMRAGRLEQIDAPDACFRQPASRFVARFLGEATFIPGRRASQCVQTALGDAPTAEAPGAADAAIDVLVRPDDLSLRAAGNGNARVEWSRYEGETRLYGVRLDTGTVLRVRMNHEYRFDNGAAVDARICSSHPLALFEPAATG